MADTVKKSRIVSEDEKDLEEALLEEFNIRLKNCMSQDDLQTQDDEETSPPKILSPTKQHIIDTEVFLASENVYDEPKTIIKQNGHNEEIYECVQEKTENSDQNYVEMVDHIEVKHEYEKVEEEASSNLYESVELTTKVIPTVTTSLTDYSEERSVEKDQKSAKDRMLLSCDETSTLLFTQTVTSPMLTPSEECIDFLKGFQRDNTLSDNTASSPKDQEASPDISENLEEEKNEDNVYENTEFYKNTTPENVYENITENAAEEIQEPDDDIYEHYEIVKETENIYQNIDEAKSQDTEDGSLDEFLQHERETIQQIEHKEIKTNGVQSEKLSGESYKELIYHHKTETNSNYYEKYTDVLTKTKSGSGNREKDTETVPAEIVKNLKSQFQNKAEAVSLSRKSESKGPNVIINQIKNKFEVTDGGVAEDSTEYSETIVETCAPGETIIKKKKVKKTRKEEKENISVNENGGLDGESFYNVNVKNLCRSFGDLTKLEKDRNNRKNAERTRTKSLTDVINSKPIENVFIGVSVRSLKEKFNSPGTNCSSSRYNTKSSFSKFDALQKKNVLHVRSTDSTKAQEKFSNGAQMEIAMNCKACSKQVFQMEQIKAEKAVWHKNCFRCIECSKQLTVDTYESNDGNLYCKPHFKALFAPKAVEEDASPKPRRPELIIRENQPLELPPDVVRASDKPDLGLEELQSLNVKERFQVFEHYQSQTQNETELEKGLNVKRSPSILSKLAKFQKHGMDIGVSNEALDGIHIEESESEEEEEVVEGEDADLVRAKRVQKEKPFHFTAMSDVKKRWEQGDHAREERREETKQEIQNIRTKLFMGKQEKMKEAYQQAVMESESSANLRKNSSEIIEAKDTKSIKERFEKGEYFNERTERQDSRNEEEEVYESEISKNSRSMFLQLDASASKPPQISPVTPPRVDVKKAREAYLEKSTSREDTVKSTELVEDVEVKTAEIQERFKFFETYKEPEKHRKQFRITPPRDPSQVKAETPEREIYRDPDVVRGEEYIDDSNVAKESHTASKMLNKFRQMEESLNREPEVQGPKPLKCFTPPPEPTRPESRSDGEESSEYEEEEDEVDQNGKIPEDLIEAQKAARAKQLRAKFEKWETNEIKKEHQESTTVNVVEEYGEEQSQIESTRVLRARFEQMRDTNNVSPKAPRVKPNRFVEIATSMTESCQSCREKVYPLEKISLHGNIYHKNCFKCMECSCVLRMDSYSYNQGLLYCTPHFKRLFISKGNYDSAFGLDQHKEKWQNSINNMTVA